MIERGWGDKIRRSSGAPANLNAQPGAVGISFADGCGCYLLVIPPDDFVKTVDPLHKVIDVGLGLRQERPGQRCFAFFARPRGGYREERIDRDYDRSLDWSPPGHCFLSGQAQRGFVVARSTRGECD